MKKIAYIFLIAANFGLPLNSWFSFVLLVVGGAVVLVGEITSDQRLWRWAGIVTISVIVLRLVIPSHEINEGHAVFDPSEKSVLYNALPKDVFEIMRQDYAEVGNKFKIRTAPRAWNISMDAVWSRSNLSRWREDLNFNNRWELRVGALNDVQHNYYRLGYNEYGAYLPLVFRFDLPNSTEGGKLCWQGIVYWPEVNGSYEKSVHENIDCRDLSDKFGTIPLTLYASDFTSKNPLSMHLEGTGIYNYTPLIKQFLGLVGALLTILLLSRLKVTALIIVAGTVSTIIIILARRFLQAGTPSGLSSMVYMERGNDGLVHYGLGREILTAILDGRWEFALRAGENIFFFMPGLRYIWTPLLALFGETLFGYWLIVSMVPFLIVLLARHFFSERWVVILLAFFVFIPIFNDMGFFQFYYSRLAVRGFGGAMAWTAFLAALVLIWPVFDNSSKRSIGALFIAGVLFAISIACRPNLAPGIMILVGVGMIVLLINSNWSRIEIVKAGLLGTGAATVFLLALHNWYFGGRFVPLVRSVDISVNLAVAPSYYFELVKALLSDFESIGPRFEKIIQNVRIWVDYDQPWFQIAYITLWVVLLWRKTPLSIRVVALSLIANHGVFLFYRGIERYTYGLWMLSLILFFWAFRFIYWPFLVRFRPSLEKYSSPSSWMKKLTPISNSKHSD